MCGGGAGVRGSGSARGKGRRRGDGAGEGVEEGGVGAKSYNGEKAWSSINLSILFGDCDVIVYSAFGKLF